MAGDMNAHSELYRMFSKAVFNLAYGICRNRECAEDVLHNSFIKLINKINSFENRAPFGMWLRQLAVNEALMYLRGQKKHKATVGVDDFSYFEQAADSFNRGTAVSLHADKTSNHHDQLDLNRILSRLPENVRVVLWLKEVEGYTHEEIATLVDKTPSYSKSIVLRAYKYLRENAGTPPLSPSIGKH